MRLIVTGMFRGLCEFVGLLELNTTISCAKTAEPIEMPFVIWTRGWGNELRNRGHQTSEGDGQF